MGIEVTPLEAGLDRFVKLDKEFIGSEAVASRSQNGTDNRLAYLAVDAEDTDVLGNEPVFSSGSRVGLTTSGAYGHAVGQSLAFAYVEADHAIPGSELEVEILGRRCTAKVLDDALYDPQNSRLLS